MLQGHRDTSLTDKGLCEAQVLASNLEGQDIDAIYHSPLLRITQTIEPVLKSRSIKEIYIEPDLKGQGLGELEGLTYDNVDFGNPRDADSQPGVEKFDDFVGRLKDVTGRIIAIEATKVGPKDRIVVVASHGVCITSIFKVLEDSEPCNGFTRPVAVRGPDAHEVRWTDSDDVAKMIIAQPNKLPIKDHALQWEKIDDKPFFVSFQCLTTFAWGHIC